ncbi:MAG TPA: hypothetical protein VNJ07_05945 [Chitinophagales bacterium]|nr:hypothetical protein [Chitinophagales bacterium]
MKFSPHSILLSLFILGASRMLIELLFYYDDYSFVSLSASYSMLYYVFTIYSSIPYWAMRIVRIKTEIDDSAEREIYRLSTPLWLIYPLVPVITILTGSSYSVEVPLFKWIPTFMTKGNFLPTGMIAVIPVILLYFTILFQKKIHINLPAVFIAIAASCTILYLLFYQWLLSLFQLVLKEYNYALGFGIYHLIMAVYLQFVMKRFLALFPGVAAVFRGFNIFNSIIFAFILLYGILLVIKG